MCYNTLAGEIMLEVIDYKDIKKYKRYITTDYNHSSCLYFDRDLIHKILYYSPKEMENLLNIINELNIEELVKIKKLIYQDKNIVGYSVKNYKQYKSLSKLKNRTFELKKQDSIKLVTTYNKILNKGFSYRDFHLGNVLLNPKTNDIKICDLDSIDFFESWKEEQYALQLLLETILEYLYNIRFCHIRNIIHSNYLSKIINEDSNNISIEYILKVINLVDSESVKKYKKEMISKSKQRIDAGYGKFR